MIKLPTEFWMVITDGVGTHSYVSDGTAYDAFTDDAIAETSTRVFHIKLDVETNAHESTTEVTNDFIDRMIENAEDLDNLPDWIKDERAGAIELMRENEECEAAHAASFSQPSI